MRLLGGRVLCAEEQKASEGHKAWEASQVHIPRHSEHTALARSLTHVGRTECRTELGTFLERGCSLNPDCFLTLRSLTHSGG